MPPLFVAIDNGSQSTKVSVFDAHGAVVASARTPLRPSVTAPGGRVQHPDDDLWDSICEACREVTRNLGDRRSDIVAVGLCTIRFCRAYLDESGRLVEPVLSWMDARVSRPIESLEPSVRWITTSSGYITHRLTGRFVDTAGNYQGVWPIDHDTWRWSSDAEPYEQTGMPRAMLFDLVDPGERLGEVTAQAAAITGLPPGLPVFATSNDKAVEALGSGLRGKGTALLSLGTYIAAMTVRESSLKLSAAGWRNFGARPGEYLYESGGIRRGMWTVSWFRDLLGGSVTDEELGSAAERVPVGSGGLMTILDWLAPQEAPFRRGAMIGFDGSQGRGAIYRSILEAIACTMHGKVVQLQAELGSELNELIVSGGGSRSELMLRILADVFDLPVRRTAFPDAAALGSAIAAAVGVGAFDTWDAAVDAMVRTVTTVSPTSEGVQAYRPIVAAHAGLRGHTDPMFRWLAANFPQ